MGTSNFRYLLLIACSICLLAVVAVMAEVPGIVSYQGRITDGGGNAVADGDYELRFRIYDDESAGSLLWDSGPRNVTVADGLFGYNLGDTTALPAGMFADNGELWLGVTVGADPEISPRTRLTASGWAKHAETVETSPGVTQYLNNSSVLLLNGFTVEIAADTITVPAAGYVLAEATMNLSCLHAGGTEAAANIEFRDSTGVHLADQEHFWVINSSMPAGNHETTINIHRIFEVVAGSHEFSVLGADFLDAGNAFQASRTVFTLTYFPASYGDVAAVGAPAFQQSETRKSRLSGSELSKLRDSVRQKTVN